jgi:hypothetical protein
MKFRPQLLDKIRPIFPPVNYYRYVKNEDKSSQTRGQCYDNYFRRFLPIFCEKNGVFLKNQRYDHFFFQKLAVVWAKNVNIFAKIFGENILNITTSVSAIMSFDTGDEKSYDKTNKYPSDFLNILA